ncbi:hypothetical protein [Aquabacterium sp.]|uniref:hypothetical protein n=1 Tax=Aquabacterium sp. TaxID=1872578 RepID=UPI0035C74877
MESSVLFDTKRIGLRAQPFTPASLAAAVSRCGVPILELNTLWLEAVQGNTTSEKKLQSIIDRHPEIISVLDMFSRGGKHRKIMRPKPANPTCAWDKSTDSWVNIAPGGLPSLGKRK